VRSVRKGRAGKNAPSSVTRKPFISPAMRTVPPWAVGYCMAGEEGSVMGDILGADWVGQVPDALSLRVPANQNSRWAVAGVRRARPQSVSTGPMATFMTGSHGHSTPSSQLPSEVCPGRRTHTSSGGMGPRRSDVFARSFASASATGMRDIGREERRRGYFRPGPGRWIKTDRK
jgi:hypothetical protein